MERHAITDNELPLGPREYYFHVGSVDRDGANVHIGHHKTSLLLQVDNPDHLEQLSRHLMDAAIELRTAQLKRA